MLAQRICHRRIHRPVVLDQLERRAISGVDQTGPIPMLDQESVNRDLELQIIQPEPAEVQSNDGIWRERHGLMLQADYAFSSGSVSKCPPSRSDAGAFR